MIGQHSGLFQDNREPKPCEEVQLYLPLTQTPVNTDDELLDNEYQQWLDSIQDSI